MPARPAKARPPARVPCEYGHRLAPPQVDRTLEGGTTSGTWPVYSPFAKEHYSKGYAAGLAEARAEGRAAAIVDVLLARGLTVDHAVRARIAACSDIGLLRTWFLAAVNAERAEDIFEA
ncbi:hypothetical protein [Nocardiopsis baichengensis]|uniref:hypothetical protein n=1 Tax=Nocardiopsis baichengensis TaxID=280240 RepID=UPI00037833E2|nr:hypothetical protein [Nocardiopsis baichengensis]